MGLDYRTGEAIVTNGICLNPGGRHAHVTRRPFCGDECAHADAAEHSVSVPEQERTGKADRCHRPFDIEPMVGEPLPLERLTRTAPMEWR